MKIKSRIFDTLFWKISGIFLVIMIILAVVFIWISVKYSSEYSQEAQQKINANIAEGALLEINPFFVDGEPNEQALHTLMHSMMAVNPSIEVYLLDPDGNILTYVVPYKEVKSTSVSLGPINEFLDAEEDIYIRGDDPRNPGEQKVFSVAPIVENEQMMGYLYIILASQEYISTMDTLENSYILSLSLRTLITVFLFTTIIGLLSIFFITRNLNRIMKVVREFREGNLGARIQTKSRGELAQLAFTFNSMANKIEQNIEELKSVEKLRRELIANVSHDLRSPIASIHGFTETIILKKDDLSESEKEKYMKIILNNTQNLSKLVDDLFELSKLEANPEQVKPEPMQLAELVQDVADKFRVIAQEKNISINTNYARDLPMVYADIQLTDRVFQNIIDNAINYCNKGDVVTIDLELQKGSVLVRIKDTGTGISTEDLPYVFDRFYKGHKRSQNDHKSTGLGLAIVKKIIDLHNSTIKVFSDLNKGTTFEFQLPVHQV